MQISDVYVVCPEGLTSAPLAIAACRAGARGFLRKDRHTSTASFQEVVTNLTDLTDAPFGIQLIDARPPAIEDLLAMCSPGNWKWALLPVQDAATNAQICSRLIDRGVTTFFTCYGPADFDLLPPGGDYGVVLKGHEAGGRVEETTAFVLWQHWSAFVERVGGEAAKRPAVVHGGIGLYTAAACVAGGAHGVVLDSQLLLTRESPLDPRLRQVVRSWDGSESTFLRDDEGRGTRGVSSSPLAPPTDKSTDKGTRPAATAMGQEDVPAVAAGHPSQSLHGPFQHVGQESAWAAEFADRFVTVAGVAQAVVAHVNATLAQARAQLVFAADSPLARSHGTRYPILQGPMTRVSDTATFAEAVASAGGLPFLALALSRGRDVEALLEATQKRLGQRPWGVGLLGFLPPEIRQKQLRSVRRFRPPFALLAGGRPDQAAALEADGISTYLHVPSPGLLRMFLRQKATRFVFEGRECGGHVGPRTSFALWETLIGEFVRHLDAGGRATDYHLVFAGGIHDRRSAAMVAALATPLADRGVRVGILMGTAYLYTREAVASGAIVPRFQSEARRATRTVLFETAPGHAIRALPTPYFDEFESERRRLSGDGKSDREVAITLERMNVGRLRVASKGLDRSVAEDGTRALAATAEDEQLRRGMYMIGQVAALRDAVTTVEALHHEVSQGSTQMLSEQAAAPVPPEACPEPPSEVAIVGMACFYPGAGNLSTYWQNILSGHNAVTEVPPSHWDWRLYYDPRPEAPDKIVSKWGGFLEDVPFDPLQFGIAPNSIPSIEPLQLLLLEAVRQALDDAGYAHRPFNRQRTCAILGIGGGGSPLAVAYGFRSSLPLLDHVPGLPMRSADLLARCDALLPTWTEDSFPGFLMNVAVGRIANRFDLGGSNYAIDAACASSLTAVHACVRELETGTADVALALGADTVQTPFAYMAFSKTHALSPTGRCRPFDARADGIVLSEGIAALVLKRLADARRDGDRVYAVIRGVGSSSDGKDKGLTAPNAAGQLRALRRAYRKADCSPATVGLMEAHGTGTVVGDKTELESLATVMHEGQSENQSCALGSVKSMIGHSKCAAGMAGLIKTALALHHQVLPPTIVAQPSRDVDLKGTALYLNTTTRPWMQDRATARRGGVSAFGFGGTNVHVVLEEAKENNPGTVSTAAAAWPTELFVWQRAELSQLRRDARGHLSDLQAGARPELREMAAALWQTATRDSSHPVLAIVAANHTELIERLTAAIGRLEEAAWQDPWGVCFGPSPRREAGQLAVLFPGQGSPYPNMLADIAVHFREVRGQLDFAARVLHERLSRPLARYLYPPSVFCDEERQQQANDLAAPEVAQPAIAAACMGALALWRRLGLSPAAFAGHSFGEYLALWAGGAFSDAQLVELAHRRGVLLANTSPHSGDGMLAVAAEAAQVEVAVAGLQGVTVANFNAPDQTVLSLRRDAWPETERRLSQHRLPCKKLNVTCAFHSPHLGDVAGRWTDELRQFAIQKLQHPVFGNRRALPYPSAPHEIRDELAHHLVAPVRFRAQIENMYAAGIRVFVEVGPQGALTGLVRSTLAGRPHLAVSTDQPRRHGVSQLQWCLAQLLVRGVPLNLDALFHGRSQPTGDLALLKEQAAPTPRYSASTWLVNGVRARPWQAPERQLLGQAPEAAEHHPQVATGVAEACPGDEAPDRLGRPAAQAAEPPNQRREAPEPLPPRPATAAQDAPDAGGDPVMLGFQALMAKFLETEEAVMRQYLRGEVPDLPSSGTAPPNQPQAASPPHAPPVPADPVPPSRPLDEPPLAPEPGGDPVSTQATAPAPADVADRLLALVSKRTGYPTEMLDKDLDLEADLGIDSIKRVEILGELAEGLGASAVGQGALELEELTNLRSLRAILEHLEQTFSSQRGAAQPPAKHRLTETLPQVPDAEGAEAAVAAPSAGDAPRVQRGLVRLVELEAPANDAPLVPSGGVVITDDGRGAAQSFASQLNDLGVSVFVLRHGTNEKGAVRGGQDDLSDADTIARLVRHAREAIGPVAGLVHLWPLRSLPTRANGDRRAWEDVRSLYLLARALEADLTQAADGGSALVLAATGMGGTLGFDGPAATAQHFTPGYGSVLGFAKCLAMEWPEVMVRAVDVDPQQSAAELAEVFFHELTDQEGPLEVGHNGRRRVTWEPYTAAVDVTRPSAVELSGDSVILLTGGARGITARIAKKLAERYQPTLVLVGHTPFASEERCDTRSLTSQPEIKAALIARQRAAGEAVETAAVEAEYRGLLRDREIRDNLAALRGAGATVDYRAADLRDERQVAKLLGTIADQYGRLDGVIHGAGVIDDKLIRDKPPASFDDVFQTKVNSAFHLLRQLCPEQLQFCVFFASIASRFGNRGQADYAAANEVLSKLAIALDHQWPGRVCSVAWGPWAEVGMVSQLENHLTARGICLIDPEEGATHLLHELLFGGADDREVLIAGGAEHLVHPARSKVSVR